MRNLVSLAFVGFLAQLIDGALGMGYGVTSSSMLLALGVAPAVASASVHAGEVVTTLISGVAHWRFGNVDRTMVWRLGVPGAAGAFLGAWLLASLPVQATRVGVAGFLFLLGVVVLVRSWRAGRGKLTRARPLSSRWLVPLGLVAGLLDATGGGGWGPVTTTTLVAREPGRARRVIGSVDASEFLVATSATAGFVTALGWEGISWLWVGAIVLGGAVAAPLAAWLVRKLPLDVLGVTVGAMIILYNARTLLAALGIPVHPGVVLLVFLVPAVVFLLPGRLRPAREEAGPV
ncbi:MAG TPA: sulfite exporter TauE/SafE family protein [Limnochordales bacterium]